MQVKNEIKDKNRNAIPYVNFSQIKDTIIILYQQGNLNEQKLSEKSKEINNNGIALSTIKNILPVTNELGLTFKIINELDKDNSDDIHLTSKGKDFSELLLENNTNKIKEFASELIKKSPFLVKTYKLLNENNSITYEELGTELKNEFNKKWIHPRTQINVAQHCVNILEGFYLINKNKIRTVRKGRKYGEKKEGGLRFTASANKIFDYIKKVDIENEIEVTSRFQSKRRNEKILSEFATLVDLNLVKEYDRKFKLTDLGKELKNTLETSNETAKFREILLKNILLKQFVYQLAKENESFNIMDIGHKLQTFNQAEWHEYTAKDYGTKILNCLKKANIAIENSRRGKYRINLTVLDEFNKSSGENKNEIHLESTLKITDIKIEKEISVFKNLLFDIWLHENNNWNSDLTIKEKIMNEIEKMKNVYIEKMYQILIEHISDCVNDAYDKNDISYVKRAGKYYTDLISTIKEKSDS